MVVSATFPDPPARWILAQTPANADEARALRVLLRLPSELRAIIWANPTAGGISCLSGVPWEHQTALCRRGLAFRDKGPYGVVLTGRALAVRAWLARFQREEGR